MRAFSVVDCEQRSESWFAARIGKVTGTMADAVLAQGRTKGSESVQRKKLRYRLALERITGKSFEKDFQTDAMSNGIAREPIALAFYEAQKGVLFERAGFCAHTTLPVGCSVDAYYGDFEGLVSIKCPEWHTHADTLRGKTIETGYLRQIVHEQLVTGAGWTDFVSFHPDFPEPLQLAVIRVDRNPQAISQYQDELLKFLAEVAMEEAAFKTAIAWNVTKAEAVAL